MRTNRARLPPAPSLVSKHLLRSRTAWDAFFRSAFHTTLRTRARGDFRHLNIFVIEYFWKGVPENNETKCWCRYWDWEVVTEAMWLVVCSNIIPHCFHSTIHSTESYRILRWCTTGCKQACFYGTCMNVERWVAPVLLSRITPHSYCPKTENTASSWGNCRATLPEHEKRTPEITTVPHDTYIHTTFRTDHSHW